MRYNTYIMPRTTNKTNSNSYTTKQNTPPPPIKTPIPLQSQTTTLQSQPPSISDSIKQGFSFGIGSAIAHNLFRSKDVNKDVNETKLTTDKLYEAYNKCLEENNNNIDCTIILQNTTL